MTTYVKFFSEGFFGYSTKQDLFLGSVAHILPIIIMIIIIALIYKFKDQIRSYKHEAGVRYVIAAVMLLAEMSFFWRLAYVGTQGQDDTMLTYLPLQMCQWGLLICVFTIMTMNKVLFSMNYFITLLFANIALIYPLVILNAGPTYFRYYQFWLEHTLPIISVFYLMFVHGMRPERKGILYTWFLIIPLTTLAIIANYNIEGARYLYLTLDVKILPSNIIARAVILFTLVMGIFYLMYLPFEIKDKKLKKKLNQ